MLLLSSNHTVMQGQHILSQSDKRIEETTGAKNRNSSVAETACDIKCKRENTAGAVQDTSVCLDWTSRMSLLVVDHMKVRPGTALPKEKGV